MRGMFQNTNYFTQLALTLTVVLSMIFLSSMVAAIVAVPLYGINIDNLSNLATGLDDPQNIALLKYLQIIASLFGFVISGLILAYIFSDNSSKYLWMERTPKYKFSLAAILLILVAFPLINFIGELNSYLQLPDFLGGKYFELQDNQNEILMDKFLADTNFKGLFVNILMIGVIPAIGEELIFRGVLQNIFSKWTKNYHWGIWISAALFSLIHAQISGFFPRMFLGAMFGYLLVWTGSIWIPILAHFINNLSAVIMYFLVNNGRLPKDTLEYGSTMDAWPFIIISAILTTGIFWFFYRNSIQQDDNSEKTQELPG
jgi:membrane protease YdiL (CAAX protease family)